MKVGDRVVVDIDGAPSSEVGIIEKIEPWAALVRWDTPAVRTMTHSYNMLTSWVEMDELARVDTLLLRFAFAARIVARNDADAIRRTICHPDVGARFKACLATAFGD